MSLEEKLDRAEAEVRATHPDAERLLDALRTIDDAVTEAEEAAPFVLDLTSAIAGLVAEEALFAAALFRAVEVMARIPGQELLSNPQEFLAALWADGVVTGVEFQRTGGHREATS